MRLNQLATPAALLLALSMTTSSAFAQSGDEGRRRSRDRSARTTESGGQRGGNRSGDVAVRRSETRGDTGRSGSYSQGGRTSDNRGYDARQNDRNSSYRNDSGRNNNWGSNNRGSSNRSYDSRSNDNRSYGSRGYGTGSYDNRSYGSRGYGTGSYNNRSYGNRGYSNRGSGWYGSYDRNRWSGRLRLGLGISIFAGSPYAFRFDYGWRPRFDYRYSMRPGMAYGGMVFLIEPYDAEVYIDGDYVGIAQDFGGQPVPVAAGYHRIELYSPGYEPVAFDINVLPGQVIPYRGNLYPAY